MSIILIMMDRQHRAADSYPDSGRSTTFILTSQMSMIWLNFYLGHLQTCAKDNASIISRFGAVAKMIKFRMFELSPEGRESWRFGRKSTAELLSECNLCERGAAGSSHVSINLSVINTSMSLKNNRRVSLTRVSDISTQACTFSFTVDTFYTFH